MSRKTDSAATTIPNATLRAITVVKEQRIQEGRPLGERLTTDAEPIAISGMTNPAFNLSQHAPIKITASKLGGTLASDSTITISNAQFDGTIVCDTLYVIDNARVSGTVTVRRLMVKEAEVSGTISASEIIQKDATATVRGTLV